MSIVYWHWNIYFKNHDFFLTPFISTPSHLPLLPFSIFCCPSLLPPLLTSLLYFFSPLFPPFITHIYSLPCYFPPPSFPLLTFPFLSLRSTLTLEGLCEMGLNSKKAMINVEKVAEKAAKEFGKSYNSTFLFNFTLLLI